MSKADLLTYSYGQIIIEEGQAGHYFYIILEGVISVSKFYAAKSAEPREHIIGTRHAGDFFGEMALLENKPSSARITAGSDVKILRLSRLQFKNLILDQPDIFMELIRALSHRLRDSNQNLIEELEHKNHELISLNKSLERKVRQRTQRLEEKTQTLEIINAKKNELLRICAHDLRHPITIILGFTEILTEIHVSPGEQAEHLKTITRHCEKMLTTINALLDISAIESGSIQLKPTFNDLNQLIKERARFFEPIAVRKNIYILLELAEKLPKVWVDTDKLEEILDNLLSNAIKFSYPDKFIHITTEQAGRQVVVHVQDQGQGLSESDKILVFREFQKLSATPIGNESSTGLGLAIVKKLVELHGGKVWVNSPGKDLGATFTFSLKIKKGKNKIL